MRRTLLIRSLAWVSLLSLPLSAATTPRPCVGSQTISNFRLTVQPAQGGSPLPVGSVVSIRSGSKLRYEPAGKLEIEEKAQVALVLAPKDDSPSKDLVLLGPKPADEPVNWDIPKKIEIVALIYGPQGLSLKKVKNLVDKNQEILAELADYADQTAQVEALVQALQTSEQTGGDLNAALHGFSAQYNVAIPKLDPKAPTDQQANVLLQAVLPGVSTYDPLGSRTQVMQQSVGLAAAVAAMFFGSPVGLAAGGAALLTNMHMLMAPDTEFRSAIAQSVPPNDAVALCAKIQPKKSRTKVAFLWAHRMSDLTEPSLTLSGDAHVPLGSKSLLSLKPAPNSAAKNLAHFRDWKLVATAATESYPATVSASQDGKSLEIDLTKAKATPGEYRLAAMWDWDPVQVAGNVFVHPYGKLDSAKLTTESRDHLVEGTGRIVVKLTGADFQFVEKVAVEKADVRQKNPQDVFFTLPKGKRAGPQDTMEAEIDTGALGHGEYRLLLTQSDGLTHELPITLLPPNPKITNLPLRANLGETAQHIPLEGTGLDRVQALTSEAAQLQLQPAETGGTRREAVVKLAPGVKKGQLAALHMKVQGEEAPLLVARGLEIAGLRPRISSVRTSFPRETVVALQRDEIPAGGIVSFALSVENLDPDALSGNSVWNGATAPLSVEISCAEESSLRSRILLAPGQTNGAARLNVAGEGLLFLSLEPGAIGQSGCELTATVTTRATGTSDPYKLGKIVRVPRVEQFVLTDERLGKDTYAGMLTGQDLDTIEKAGWDARTGIPVDSIPTPVAGSPGKQILKIALPWPAPAPHSPVYVWLRGESQGRATGVKY